MSSTSSARSMDPRAVVVGGLTTFAWYAVPDVVGPRWARALAKSAVMVAGATLAVTVTRDGERARAAVGALSVARAPQPSAADGPDPEGFAPDGPDPEGLGPDVAGEVGTDNPAPLAPTGAAPEVLTLRTGAAVVAATGAVAALVALGALGERWIYRGAEALRVRGVRTPHVLVGLGMGAVAAGLAAIDVGDE